MARAGDLVAGQFPGGQRPAVMGADVVEGMERPVDVEQGDHVAVDLDHGRSGIGQFPHRGHPHKISHRTSSRNPKPDTQPFAGDRVPPRH